MFLNSIIPLKTISLFICRFSENVQEFLCLFLYLPFGVILFIIRLLVALIVLLLGYILPNTEVFQHVLYKLTCFVLGITVNLKNPKQREDVEVYVSNCLSHFDHLAVHSATGCVMVTFVCLVNARL